MPFKRCGILILLGLLTVIISTSRPSVAQAEIRLEQLQVDLWPEYDRPDMLVIYRGTLPADTPLPATLTLRIPARVGQPHAVAYSDETDNLLEANHSTQVTGDWLAVTLETPTPHFQVEFYDSLTRAGERRSYTFVWPGDYAIEQLGLSVLPPAGATEIQTEPVGSLLQQDPGSARYMGILGSQAARQELRVTISYRGTASGASEVAVLSTREDNSNNNGIIAGLIAGIIIAALALVIGGSVWYTRRPERQPVTAASTPRRRAKGKRRASRTRATQGKPSPGGFCTHCGRPLRVDDRFCGHCGTPVKGKTETPD
jgi:hypothetical protein